MIEVGSLAVGFLDLRVISLKILVEAIGKGVADADELVKRRGCAVRVGEFGVRDYSVDQ